MTDIWLIFILSKLGLTLHHLERLTMVWTAAYPGHLERTDSIWTSPTESGIGDDSTRQEMTLDG